VKLSPKQNRNLLPVSSARGSLSNRIRTQAAPHHELGHTVSSWVRVAQVGGPAEGVFGWPELLLRTWTGKW